MALPTTEYDPLFQSAGEKHGVDPAILKAIASVESDFRPDAVGPRTRSGQAKGMMQFIPATAKAYGLEDPFNPEQSVDAAARLMKDLLKQFKGDVGSALEAYNGGPRLVGKSKQTAAYREKVLQRAKLADTTQFAQNKRTPMPETTPRVALSNVSDMPAGYKAAIALQYFTDTDPEGNPVESAEQTLAALEQEQEDLAYEQTKPAGGSLLQKFFSSQNEGSVSPFDIMAGMQQPEAVSTDQGPEQVAQAEGFADGGFVFGGTSLPGMPNPRLVEYSILPQKEREFLQAQQDYYDRYVAGFPGYEKAIADYNKAIEQWNAGPRETDFNVPEPKAPRPPDFDVEGFANYVDQVSRKAEEARKLAPQRELALDVVNDPAKYNLSGFGFKDGGEASKQGMLDRVKRFIVENDLTPADFMLTPNTIPLGMMLQPSEANAGEAEALERYRRMAEQEQGKVVGRAKGSGPRAEEVPQLDEFGRVILPEPEPEPEYSLLEKLYGVGETAASIGSSIPAAVVGSMYGAYKGLTSDKYGTPEGVREAEAAAGDVMKGMTFMPRGKAGQGYTEAASKVIPQELQGAMPQSQLMNLRVNPGAARYLGERAREGTEAAIMPVLRSQTENPNLRPEAVYDAMLGDPAETVKAGALAAAPIQRIDKDLFSSASDELDNIPITPEVEQVLSAHIGGVGNFGDPDAKYYLRQVPGGSEYTQQAQNVAQKYFGNEFMGYRLMPKEEFEALKAGDLGDLMSFSLSKDAANAFRRFTPNQGREDLILAEVPLTPNHVLGFGHRGEQEVIVDTSVGWSLDAFKRSPAPKQKEAVDRSLLMPSEDRPFVGELERRIADLPGPVQKQQLMGMLKKDGREYEMIRLEQALEQYGPSDKLTPNQIMSALKDTSPQRYVMEVFEPDSKRQADFISHVDNPYPSKPLGTANLSLALTEDQKNVRAILERQYETYRDLNVIAGIAPTFSIPSASRTEFLTKFDGKLKSITSELESIDSIVARNIQYVYNENISGVKEFSKFLDNSDKVTIVENDPRIKQIVDNNALSLSVTDNGKKLKEILGPDATKILEEKGITFPLPIGANQLELIESVLIKDNANKLFKDAELAGYMSATLKGAGGPEDPIFKLIDDVIARSAEPKTAAEKQELAKEHIANKQMLRQEMRPFELGMRQVLTSILAPIEDAVADGIDAIRETSLAGYTQGHTSIASNNPISFARFVDMDVNDAPALNDPRGAMVFTELQSDRRAAIKKGTLSDVEEAFPGMDVVSEDVLRQLIAKSAVAAAAKRGKGVVLFPSSDSMQPQLYTPEIMGRVAKQVAKDLGKGYQAKQFVVPSEKGITRKVPPPKKDADGNFIEQPLIQVIPSKTEDFTVTRWGIVLPEDSTQAIPQQGIRFAKGGAVNKSMYDRNP